jgi:hypothetical protein
MKKTLLYVLLSAFILASAPAIAEDCIDVELNAQPIAGDPYDYLQIIWSVVNCGTADARVHFTLTLQRGFDYLASIDFYAYLRAGVPLGGTIRLPVICCIPEGMYTLCMKAEVGTAQDQSCAAIVVDEANNITAFTKILEPIAVEPSTWGSIKNLYR